MKSIGSRGLALIKQFEGLRLEAYRDTGGVWTVGFGHTLSVKPGDKITEAQAETLLKADLITATKSVDSLVTVPLTENQRDALISFEFNTGGLMGSTLLKLLNAKDYVGACAEFARWHKDNGVRLRGLLRRRVAEMALYLE